MANILKRLSNYLENNNPAKEDAPIVIVDVGCRWGFADKFIQNKNIESMKIYGFDPDAQECERLESMYNNENIKLIPVGLSNQVGKRTLYLTKEPACSSLYKPNKKLTQEYPALDCATEVKQVEVDLSTLDTWAKQENLGFIDYIKIDTQGAELSILHGGEKILPSIRFLEIEVEFNPIYDGQPIFSEVDSYLRKFGFVLWKFSNLVHYSQGVESDVVLKEDSINYDHHRIIHENRGGQVYWADAFYIKKDIVDTLYKKTDLLQLEKDAEIARMLGFLDLELRLKSFKLGMEE